MYSAGSPNQYAETARISQNGNGYFEGTVRCKGGLNVGDHALLPSRCAILFIWSHCSTISNNRTWEHIIRRGYLISRFNQYWNHLKCRFINNSNRKHYIINRNITGRSGLFNTISCTGTISSTTVTVQGVFAGVATTDGVIDMSGTEGAYIDFTAPNADYKGLIFYANSSNTFKWRVGGVPTTVMQLSSASLQVIGTVVKTSDKRFKSNEKQ